MINRYQLLFPTLLGLCLLAGCSSGSGPTLVAADGTVTYQGKPLAGATVLFVPDKGPLAMGVTDTNGKFVLSTGTTRGAVAGPAKVTVTAAAAGNSEALDAVANQPKSAAESEAYMKKAAEMQQAVAAGKAQDIMPISLIPEKYSKTDTSGLTYTIKSSASENHFKIDLM